MNRFAVAVRESDPTTPTTKYTGDTISLNLRDADIRDVIGMFGKLTGYDTNIDDDVAGKVTVQWQNVPWDQALDSLLTENGLTYRIEGKTHVSRR